MKHEWMKEGICVNCKHKENCKRIQAGVVVRNCDLYERNSRIKILDEIA